MRNVWGNMDIWTTHIYTNREQLMPKLLAYGVAGPYLDLSSLYAPTYNRKI